MFDAVQLEDVIARSAVPDLSPAAGKQMMDDVRTLELARRHLDGAEMALLASLDALGTTDMITGHRTANWLTKVAELSPAVGRSRVKLGRRLAEELPETLVAMGEGRICADRARLILDAMNDRVASQFRQMQAPLIEKSRTMTTTPSKPTSPPSSTCWTPTAPNRPMMSTTTGATSPRTPVK